MAHVEARVRGAGAPMTPAYECCFRASAVVVVADWVAEVLVESKADATYQVPTPSSLRPLQAAEIVAERKAAAAEAAAAAAAAAAARRAAQEAAARRQAKEKSSLRSTAWESKVSRRAQVGSRFWEAQRRARPHLAPSHWALLPPGLGGEGRLSISVHHWHHGGSALFSLQ